MIDLLDRALRAMLLAEMPELLTDESQVRFQPPDEQWRAAVANLQVNGEPVAALNLYLAEIRQNRQRRSNERTRVIRDGAPAEEPAPSWIDCHYLVTAWSPAASELVEPTPDEHALLHRTLVALQDAAPVNPSRIHPADSAALTAWPERWQTADLPTELLPVDGFGKLAEFWGTMGTGHRWKPVLHLVVGLPVVWSTPTAIGRPVHTVVLRLGPPNTATHPDGAEQWVRIGGRVRHQDGRVPATPAEVAVLLDDAVLRHTAASPATGRYQLELPLDAVQRPGRYLLRARAADLPDAESPLDWRAANHDLIFP